MSRRAPNEVKTRLDDDTYEGLLAYMALNGIEHVSGALERVTRLFLFGTVGTLPKNLVSVASQESVMGIAEHA
jgi:hypothetical protein